MRWVKRGCWIAAWGVWAWLGVGLAHHLPKRPGELVCRWDRGPAIDPFIFLHGQREFATLSAPAQMGPSVIHVRDVATGSIAREFAGPLTYHTFMNYCTSSRFPYLVTSREYRPGAALGPNPNDMAILDLRTGEWFEVPAPCIGLGDFHHSRPWHLCTGSDVVSVVDLEAKRVIFQWKPEARPLSAASPGHPFFLGDHHVAIPVERVSRIFGLSGAKSHALEIWSLVEPDRSPQVLEGVEAGYGAQAGGSRVLWSKRSGLARGIEVFDLDSKRLVYPIDVDGEAEVKRSSPALSADGRRLLDGRYDPGTAELIDIDSGTSLWTADFNERTWGGDDEAKRFQTTEDWGFTLFGWKQDVVTWTQRSLYDGSLLLRSWEHAPYPSDVTGEFFLAQDGVRRLPFRIDWPFLAICQTILALPLILLWTILCWRRKRSIRMAGVA
jgi:hypothetical protein